VSERGTVYMRGRTLSVVLLGVLLGELVFILLFSRGEDFWQHYYASHTIRQAMTSVDATADGASVGWHPYPMFTGVLVLPLSFLPPSVSLKVWFALLYVIFGLAIYAFAERVAGYSREFAVNVSLLCMVWPVTFCAVFLGQISPIILSLFVAAYLLFKSGKPYAAGFVLSLALLKPHFALPVAGAFALRREWRVTTAFCLGAVILGSVSLRLGQNTSPDSWSQFIFGWFLARPTVSLVSLLQPLTPGWRALAAMLGLFVLGVWWVRKQCIRPVDAAGGLLACLLVSPYVPTYDLVLLAPVVVLLVPSRDGFFWLGIVLSSLSLLGFGFRGASTLAVACFGVALLRMSRNSTWRREAMSEPDGSCPSRSAESTGASLELP
jgi:hypothetical protein